MSLNLFNKVYLCPDYLYDNAYNRIIFSAERNQAAYLNYDSFNFPGLDAEVIHSTASVTDLIGEGDGQFASVAHYVKHIFDSNFEGRIYADEASWIILFYVWSRIAFPNITNEALFTIYNIIKQREELVFPDNRDLSTFIVPRLNARNSNIVLTRDEFIAKMEELKAADTTDVSYYSELNTAIKNSLCVEIQMATYLANKASVDIVAEKLVRFGSKIMFSMVEALKDYIRENIMTERVKSLTGVNLSWNDQNWETTLRSTNTLMDFLFNSSYEAIYSDYEYRSSNLNNALEWCRWVSNITNEEDLKNPDLRDIQATAQHLIKYADGFSSDEELKKAAAITAIQEDINFAGTTLIFQTEGFREKINTFWLEYIYQLAAANNTLELEKISHT